MRRLHGKVALAGPEASKPAHWATSGIEVVVVVCVCVGAQKKDGAAGGGARADGGGRLPVTRRTQVHLCRAVAGIKVPYGQSEGARRVENNSPRAQSAHCSSHLHYAALQPRARFLQLPARRLRARTHTDTHRHAHARTHIQEFVWA